MKGPRLSRARRRGPQRPRKVSERSLENAALAYLQRYASSAANLRRVLMRRVLRSAAAHDTDPEQGARWIDALIERYQKAGLLDDDAYARMRAETLHRAGASARRIRATLAVKGVGPDIVDGALDALDETMPDVELAAACNYARRRRLGPWRRSDRAGHRERDLAALGRQGFSYETARRVIDAEDPETLAEALRLAEPT